MLLWKKARGCTALHKDESAQRRRMLICSAVLLQVEAEGDVATAVTLARILSSIPLSRGGPTSVVIFDIHALQARLKPILLAPGMCSDCAVLTDAAAESCL